MRVMDLPNWPPSYGDGKPEYTITNRAIILKEVYPADGSFGRRVSFSGELCGELIIYDFFAPSGGMAKKLAAALQGNLGRSILSVGDTEIPK